MSLTLTRQDLKKLNRRVENGVAVKIEAGDRNSAPKSDGSHSDVRSQRPTYAPASLSPAPDSSITLGPNSPLHPAAKKPPAPVTEGPKYRSKGEAMYGGRLFVLQRAGDISEWRHEAITLRLGDRVRYTVDFYIRNRDGSIELHEVKGATHTWEDARVKLRVAASMYPEFRFFLVRVKRGQVESITPVRAITETT